MRHIQDKAQWDKLIAKHNASFLQSYAWGEFQKNHSKVFRFADGDACAQVEQRSLGMGFECWVIPRGPQEFTSVQYAELKKLAAKAGVVFIRCEPKTAPPQAKRAASLNPAVTLITDLSQTEEQLLSGMHAKTRYNIRLAQKKNVSIRESQDVNEWLVLHHQTTARDQFKGHSDKYYRDMLACPLAKLYVADYTDDAGKTRALAALIAIFHGDTVTYLHGASSNDAREVMAPYALHWQVMRVAKAQGYKRYDWWGMNPESQSNPAYKQSWEGITRFKRGFGGSEIEYPGTFEIPIRKGLYGLYTLKRMLGL